MTTLTVIGVDPGGRHTGVVARRGDHLLASAVITRDGPYDLPAADYLLVVRNRVSSFLAGNTDAVVAVESVKPPNPHVRVTNVAGLLGCAMVYGAVLAHWPDSLVVEPAGHGSNPLGCYPFQLVGAREKRGAGELKHCRSAWDIAGTALATVKFESKFGGGA